MRLMVKSGTYISWMHLGGGSYKGGKGEIMELQNTVFQYTCILSLLTWLETVPAKWKINFYLLISCNHSSYCVWLRAVVWEQAQEE